MPGVVRILNDNHCKDPLVQLDLSVVGQNKSSQNNMPRTVYLRPAVIHVPIVVGTGQPKKKSLSPAPCLTEIKHVKSVKSFCLSVSFCPLCTKCPQCCRKSTCRRQVTKVLGNMAQPRFKSSGGLHLEERLQPPIQDEAPIDQVTYDNQWIRQSSQEQLLEGGIVVTDHQTGGRKSSDSVLSSLLQPAVHSSQTKQQMASHLRSEQTQSFPQIRNFQNGNSRDNQTLPSTGGVSHILGLQ